MEPQPYLAALKHQKAVAVKVNGGAGAADVPQLTGIERVIATINFGPHQRKRWSLPMFASWRVAPRAGWSRWWRWRLKLVSQGPLGRINRICHNQAGPNTSVDGIGNGALCQESPGHRQASHGGEHQG